MTLAASKGTVIRVQCVGDSAKKDLDRLTDLIKNNFGEEKPYQKTSKKKKL